MPDHPAVIFTEFHSITGTVAAQDRRLSDLLNDSRESVIHLRDSQVSRHTNPGVIIAQHPLSIVPKESITIAFEAGPREASSTKRLYSFVRKQPHRIFIALDGFEVNGLMHTLGKIDPKDIQQLITMQKDNFLPVTEANVTFATDEQYQFKRDSIIVNVKRIRYFAEAES